MNADPFHEILVLLALLGVYSAVASGVWVILCRRNQTAVRLLNAAVADRRGPAFSGPAGSEPDLDATLIALVAEERLSPVIAARLRRITPVVHQGKWVVYPSNAYWAYRFKRLRSR